MKTHNYDLLESAGVHTNVTLGVSRNLNPINVSNAKSLAIQLVMTGTPAGAWKLQVSNDPVDSKNTAPSNWSDVADSSVTVSAAGDVFFEYPECAAEWCRAVYTASGAGTVPVLTVARATLKEY